MALTPPDDEQRRYSANTIERLLEGYVWDAKEEAWKPASPAWADARSFVEHHGMVEHEALVEVLDIERAVTHLQRHHRLAGAVVILTLFGWSGEEVARVLDLHTPYERLLAKAKNYLQAYLSGEDPEQAFKSTRRPGEAPWHDRVRTWHAPDAVPGANGRAHPSSTNGVPARRGAPA